MSQPVAQGPGSFSDPEVEVYDNTCSGVCQLW